MMKLYGELLMALALICPTLGYGVELPKGQPIQIRIEVIYDSNLYDPFFESTEWGYPWWIIKHSDGHIENTMGGPTDENELPRLQHTAKCSTSHQFDHQINFCDATLLPDGTLELFIHDESASTSDSLRVLVKDGQFTSQYWTFYPANKGDERLIWTTTRQDLVLDKRAYNKGDELRGRIRFECLQELTNLKDGGRFPKRITIQGVFRTQVE